MSHAIRGNEILFNICKPRSNGFSSKGQKKRFSLTSGHNLYGGRERNSVPVGIVDEMVSMAVLQHESMTKMSCHFDRVALT